MSKKYELTSETIETDEGITLYRIKALKDFGNVNKGDLGGFIESEDNLSQEGITWVYDNARVFGDAKVFGNALVYGNAVVFGTVLVYGNAQVSGDAKVFRNARVYENAQVSGNACVYENAQVFGNARVYGNAVVFGTVLVYGNAQVSGDVQLYGNAQLCGNAQVSGDACIYGNAKVTSVDDYSTISNFGTQYRTTTFFRCEDGEIRVSCGCFYGTIPEFKNQVKGTREGKIAKEYLIIADLMDEHFSK